MRKRHPLYIQSSLGTPGMGTRMYKNVPLVHPKLIQRWTQTLILGNGLQANDTFYPRQGRRRQGREQSRLRSRPGRFPLAAPLAPSRAVPAPSRGERPSEAPHREFIVCHPGKSFHKLPGIQVLQDLSLLPCEQQPDEHLSRPFSAPTFAGYISSTSPLCPLFQVFCLLKTLYPLKHLSLTSRHKMKKGVFF